MRKQIWFLRTERITADFQFLSDWLRKVCFPGWHVIPQRVLLLVVLLSGVFLVLPLFVTNNNNNKSTEFVSPHGITAMVVINIWILG